MIQGFLLTLFWVSLITIVYCFIGFPILLAIRSLLIPPPKIKTEADYLPYVSIIIAAYNEANSIVSKIDNILSSKYPLEQLEIIVASDGSNDGTNTLVADLNCPQVRLLTLPRQGKNLAINEAVKATRGEILVFTDADSLLGPDSLGHIVAPFADDAIGGVSGDYRHNSLKVKQQGERAYWNYDRFLKRLQTANGNVGGAAGALYAIRSSLFRPVPTSVTDDFFSAMQVVSARYRLIFEPRAVSYGPVAASPKAEYKRKVRVMTRGLRGIWLMRRLLNPFSYGFFSVQLFTHKVLRRLLAIPLILMLITAPLLWNVSWIYQAATLVQFAFHALALTGFLLQNTGVGQNKLLNIPYHFDLVYYASLVALNNLIRGNQYATWGPERVPG
jgi:cellulose synthase/poly-beta-1,6-N-acetylglucosamine synthase-like glycosyltransferase